MQRLTVNLYKKRWIDFGKLKIQDYKGKYQERVIEMLKEREKCENLQERWDRIGKITK